MKKPIFVLIPGIEGEHSVRVDRIVNVMSVNNDANIRSVVFISPSIEGAVYKLNSSATVREIHGLIQEELTSLKNL